MYQQLLNLAIEEDLFQPGYEYRRIDAVIHLSQNGQLLSIEDLDNYYDLTPLRLPGESLSGTKADPFFLIFNYKDRGNKEKGKKFKAKIEQAFQDTKDSSLKSILKFINGKIQLPDTKNNRLYCFQVYGDSSKTHLKPNIRQYHITQFQQAIEKETTESISLVTGERGQCTKLFPKVKGCNLIAYDKEAFKHYDYDGLENSPLNYKEIYQISTALNRVVSREYPDFKGEAGAVLPSLSVRIQDASDDKASCYLFFLASNNIGAVLSDCITASNEGLSFFNLANKVEESTTQAASSIYTGKKFCKEALEGHNVNYGVLRLKNQDRLRLYQFRDGDAWGILSNIRRWFDELGHFSLPVSLYRALKVCNAKNNRLQNVIIEAMLQGTKLPISVGIHLQRKIFSALHTKDKQNIYLLLGLLHVFHIREYGTMKGRFYTLGRMIHLVGQMQEKVSNINRTQESINLLKTNPARGFEQLHKKFELYHKQLGRQDRKEAQKFSGIFSAWVAGLGVDPFSETPLNLQESNELIFGLHAHYARSKDTRT